MSKKVYTVRGSEDGIIGVYSSKTLAWKKAVAYVTSDVNDVYMPQSNNGLTMSALRTKFYQDEYAYIYGDHIAVELEMFFLNQ